ncbi:hypothetical protein FD724_22365 [Nostoc sp. C057]|uniref:hypothetical protein n=1 Tax=Nostoc sp. C057 TaxID=2576903 RepID=UPI0015C40A17|nr:hypothetical protein [Nostoc sp. C057]QLE50565.1 hypothetical protein FD724_22365 [Nostoc sp. C057]
MSLITAIARIHHQPKLLIWLCLESDRLPDLLPLIPSVGSILAMIAPGVVIEIKDLYRVLALKHPFQASFNLGFLKPLSEKWV